MWHLGGFRGRGVQIWNHLACFKIQNGGNPIWPPISKLEKFVQLGLYGTPCLYGVVSMVLGVAESIHVVQIQFLASEIAVATILGKNARKQQKTQKSRKSQV